MDIILKPPRQAYLVGQLDSRGAGQIYDQLVEFVRGKTEDVTINTEAVTSFTRAGCSVLFVAAKLAQAKGAKVRIRNASSGMERMCMATGFGSLLKFE
ncbi:hypothetical protein AIOL_004665 [Candidatus Rhodobacter oscarellae]|uniref:STAS domain-containing protein n=1 Tax=Candidatus Rhodobacter oscarellae TaxID=1675527 RepID=A0A0J9H1T6_9RHOB|nr:STAS domain-containing protein [Candidatus Rhodobacter lobularis]KMW59683.1 hypothetical protein AIOL_004665 [Candidatus Rhodobacter lobularis]